ncbi:hypothetical protein NCCP28_04580 [Niallia sp. NCCP-28]|nr:hypothetical protein NCCP28_04580 [Niallia sp. NCCP-28]
MFRQNIDSREETIPWDYITIGEDGSGDKLCLKINNGIMNEEIYLWHHENREIEIYAPNLKTWIYSIPN